MVDKTAPRVWRIDDRIIQNFRGVKDCARAVDVRTKSGIVTWSHHVVFLDNSFE